MDPVSDIMAATKGIPIGAFAGQNHDAHIQTKMAYLQDPMNGSNPIMGRLRPILEANIQEHSVMKYQEQVAGMTQQLMQEAGPDAARNPQVIEMITAQAAQQVLNANMAMGMAQSPEQQLVSLEQAKVELEKQKLQNDTAISAADMELKNKKLELEENDQIISMLKTNSTDNFKREKAELDRNSKQDIKALEALTLLAIEAEKQQGKEKENTTQEIFEFLKQFQGDNQ